MIWSKEPPLFVQGLLCLGIIGLGLLTYICPYKLARHRGVDVLLYGASLRGTCTRAYCQGASYCLQYTLLKREYYPHSEGVPESEPVRVWITEKVSQRTFAQAVVGQDYVVKYLNLEEDGPRYTILTNSPWQIEIPQRLRDYLSTPHDED